MGKKVTTWAQAGHQGKRPALAFCCVTLLLNCTIIDTTARLVLIEVGLGGEVPKSGARHRCKKGGGHRHSPGEGSWWPSGAGGQQAWGSPTETPKQLAWRCCASWLALGDRGSCKTLGGRAALGHGEPWGIPCLGSMKLGRGWPHTWLSLS